MLAPLFWILALSLTSTSCCRALELRDVFRSLPQEHEHEASLRRGSSSFSFARRSDGDGTGAGAGQADLEPIELPSPRAMALPRKIQPWGDGFVRMQLRRHVFNDTHHFRTARLRRPTKPTYPAEPVSVSAGSTAAMVASSSSGSSSSSSTPLTLTAPAPSSAAARVVVSARDGDGGTGGNGGSGPPGPPGPPGGPGGAPGGPGSGWGWSHLDDYEGMAYMIELDIGTPPQKVMVSIDTGSYELWVNPKCIGSPDPMLCGSYGHYFPQVSNSSSYIGPGFKIVYGTGEAAGAYYTDTLKVAMFQVPGVQFAVASDTNYTYSGVLGLGYSYPFTTKYPTLLSTMWELGYIAAPVFSMGLGGDGDGFSEIIFGGVNRWKFSGPLEPVPIWPPIDKQDPTWLQYWVNLTSVGMTPPGQPGRVYTDTQTFSMPMLIDSGSTLSYMREDIVQVVGQELGATIDANNNYWVDCKLRDQNGTVDFGFNHGRMIVSVRYRDFVWEEYHGHCLMGLQPADTGSTNYVLGDTFLRGAYLVFDQQSDVVWIADYYDCGDGVVSVGEQPADTGRVIGQC